MAQNGKLVFVAYQFILLRRYLFLNFRREGRMWEFEHSVSYLHSLFKSSLS